MRYAGLALIPAAIVFSACSDGGGQPASRAPTGPAVKIAVMRDGALLIDGQVADPAELLDRLFDVVRQDGYLWYYREGGDAEPSADAAATLSKVMDAITTTQLPVRFSSRPDFSDYIDAEGHSRTP